MKFTKRYLLACFELHYFEHHYFERVRLHYIVQRPMILNIIDMSSDEQAQSSSLRTYQTLKKLVQYKFKHMIEH